MSEKSSDLRLFDDMENGDKCNPGKANPAAAAAWRDCKRAAECSCAFRLSSATELDRGSGELAQLDGVNMEDTTEGVVDEEDEMAEVGGEFVGLIGQHEQESPENAGREEIKNL